MKMAAEMEDSTSKHPVTPGEVLPARELYADMLLQAKQNQNALRAYEQVLQQRPNRFNSLFGAGIASEGLGDHNKTATYYRQLLSIADPTSNRPELVTAKIFLKKYPSGATDTH